MNLDLYKYIYLVGAGGIGMSALARYFNMNRKMVYGYDKVRSNLCLELEDEGVSLRYQDNVSVIPEPIKSAKDKEVLVIYTPAVPENNKILSFFSTNGFMIFKRAEILGLISQDVFTIAVAGTHGKTTTSTMLAHILYQSGKEVTAFLGGISRNYDTNLLLANKMDFLIIEADEYDRSFLELNMDIAIVTSVDPDHLDIYKDVNDLHKAFQEFVGLIKPNGFLLLEESIHIDLPVIDSVTKATYSVKHSAADYFSENIRIDNGKMIFDMVFSDNLFAIDSTKKEKDIELMMPGFHNISNALAAVAVACYLEVPFDNISRGLKNFRGIKRRFDTHIETNELVYIDDYAHHPEEISLTIDTAKQLYPLRHLSVVFQPHLFSRTQEFANDFAVSLKKADDLVLLDIFPARENPIVGVSSHMILELCHNTCKEVCSKDELVSILKNKNLDVLLTLGAGDIGALVQPIKQMLN